MIGALIGYIIVLPVRAGIWLFERCKRAFGRSGTASEIE